MVPAWECRAGVRMGSLAIVGCWYDSEVVMMQEEGLTAMAMRAVNNLGGGVPKMLVSQIGKGDLLFG